MKIKKLTIDFEQLPILGITLSDGSMSIEVFVEDQWATYIVAAAATECELHFTSGVDQDYLHFKNKAYGEHKIPATKRIL